MRAPRGMGDVLRHASQPHKYKKMEKHHEQLYYARKSRFRGFAATMLCFFDGHKRHAVGDGGKRCQEGEGQEISDADNPVTNFVPFLSGTNKLGGILFVSCVFF